MLIFLLAKIKWIGEVLDSLPYVSTVLKQVKSLVKFTPHVGAVGCMMLMALFLVLKSPNMHAKYIRHTVGSRVYKVMGNKYGGTGFQLKAPSGASYIITNDHICESAFKDGHMDVSDNEGNTIPRRVLERSLNTDLCIIEGMPGVEGLKLGDEPTVGSEYMAIGHPDLAPMVITKGEVTAKTEDVRIKDHEMKNGITATDRCDKPKQDYEKKDIPASGVNVIYTCYDTTSKAYNTSILVWYGSSGSPLVNFWGKVVGVIFAMQIGPHYGYAVNIDDLKFFIRNY